MSVWLFPVLSDPQEIVQSCDNRRAVDVPREFCPSLKLRAAVAFLQDLKVFFRDSAHREERIVLLPLVGSSARQKSVIKGSSRRLHDI